MSASRRLRIAAPDSHGTAVFGEWFEHDLDCWFTDEDQAKDLAAVNETTSRIEPVFFRKMADVVEVLHDRGGTLGPSGRRVPIIVHGLEYLEETAVQNARVNPSEILPAEFLRFCRGLPPDL